jgi:hypothetical protein
LLNEPSSHLVAGLTNLSIQAAIDVREWVPVSRFSQPKRLRFTHKSDLSPLIPPCKWGSLVPSPLQGEG